MLNNFHTYFALIIIFITSCAKDKVQSFPECNPYDIIINDHKVEGYSDKVSYSVGDTINFQIHSLTEKVDISIYRYGYTNSLIHSKVGIPSFPQNYNCRSYSFGCDWETTYQYIIPSNLTPGIYSATITNERSEIEYISFVIKNPTLNPNDILVLASTNTWQAYNDWSGESFYKYGLNQEVLHSTIVSFLRPNRVDRPTGNIGHLVNAELHLHRWLENMGYSYDVAADIDLHNDATLLDNYKLLILNVHPEYWSNNMYNNLIHFLNNGGKLMYLGGNGVYWRVALKYNRIEVKKEGEDHIYDTGSGGRWRDLGMPESKYLGVQYSHNGYGTYAPYEVLIPNHWIFDSTNLALGDLFGDTCLNKGGASGRETDDLTSTSPINSIMLAKGINPDDGGAEMVYYMDSTTNAEVFSVGSITYTGSLAVDSNVSRITKNVIDRFIQ